MDLQIIHEDNHLLAVCKPAGLLVQGDRSGDVSLLDLARADLKQRYGKPGNVYLGLVHRLDRNVSGVVLLARTSKAAGRLSRRFRDRDVEKVYLAVVQGSPPDRAGELSAHFAAKADVRGMTRISDGPFRGSREGRLVFEVLESGPACTLVRIKLLTGRRHQIRAQFAHVGCPLLGDVKYGASERLPQSRIALHARELTVAHPVGEKPVRLVCEPPADWPWPV